MGKSMKGREWCPSAWLDETVPELCDDPNGFIVETPNGLRLRSPEFQDGDDIYDEPVEIGQTFEFCWTEDRGYFDVMVHSDGSWSPVTRSPPAASCYWIKGDSDTIADTVQGVIDAFGAEPGDVVIHAYHWSCGTFFRLEATPDGPSFVRLDPLQAETEGDIG